MYNDDDSERSQKSRGSNELVLNPGEYAFLQDNTKGNVQTFVGPIVITQTGQLRPILFGGGCFSETNLQDAAVQCVSAKKGEYLVLENPTKENDGLKHPAPANNNTSAPDLRHGEKIVVPGPIEFAPWPQQSAILIDGHHLRPDQYLLVRVYDEDAAVANWSDAIAKTNDKDGGETIVSKTAEELNLLLGKLLIIKDVSFYIPPTGVEVVPTGNGEYVRDALTLEMSEYAILVDSNGNKRYETGPQIVFPKPTEEFFEENDSIKFRPIELTPAQGLHIKINCDYKDEAWPVASVIDADADADADAARCREFNEGDEVFITGATHPIYYPREEHSIVRYGDNLIHYATAVSAGQARYVMNKNTGEIETRLGPDMILLNPIDEVFVTRVLSDAESLLMYPGNQDSLEYNRSLRQFQIDRGSEKEMLTNTVLSASYADHFRAEDSTRSARPRATKAALPDQIVRRKTYTKPHSVTLDDRFAGAPTLKVWTGSAVLLVKADGERRVEVGPKVVTLDYDETVSPLHLSTGKPKTTDNLLTTGYLEVANNKVSDIVAVETSDGVHVNLKLSYRVSFMDDEKKWFDIDNYVKFLCDHCRSLLKGEARRHTIRAFYTDPVAVIRDTILGVKIEGEKRVRLFKEDGMTVTDVEVLDVTIADADISHLLQIQQQEVITNQIAIDRATQQLEVAAAQAENEKATLKLRDEIRQLKQEIELVWLADQATVAETRAAEALKRLQEQDAQAAQEQKTKNADHEGELKRRTNMVDLELRQNEAETANVVARFEAANGDLAAAIRQLGDEQLLEKVAEAMGPMRIIGGGTITDALAGLIGGKGELFNRLVTLIDSSTE
jgi:major vault protein